MAIFKVEGGRRLRGEITPQGAKNEALQILCATLLTQEKVIVHNVPQILDMIQLIELLQAMGVEVERLSEESYSFRAADIDPDYLRSDDYCRRASRLGGSVMLLGPMLARFGVGYMPKPGGDKIGRRRLDTHFIGFQKLGATLDFDTAAACSEVRCKGTQGVLHAARRGFGDRHGQYHHGGCDGQGFHDHLQRRVRTLHPATVPDAQPHGRTHLGHRLEPAHHRGCPGAARHRTHALPDMIEVGSFIGLAAMTRSELTIRNVSFENLGIIPAQFARLGIRFEQHGDDIYIPQQEHYRIENFMDGSIMTIADAPWPGLTPDLLSVFLVVATQAKGSVLIHQKMFESRLFFVDKLIDMGAQIILCDPHRATVIGHDHQMRLRATRMTSPDIRAGVAR